MSWTRSIAIATCLALLLALIPATALAQSCPATTGRPGATLLFPYFEVDLNDPEGMTTLLSIGNASARRAIAHVILWTNTGEPVLSFSIYLLKGAVLSIDMRDVISGGTLPDTFPKGPLPPISCRGGLLSPTLDESERAALEARLLGEADPSDGLCYALEPQIEGLVTGYVTVDMMATCPEFVRTPFDPGYFDTADRLGLAIDAQALVGDLIYVNGKDNPVRAVDAVPVTADDAYFEDVDQSESFYGIGNRVPLGSRYMTRFFNGGSLGAATELIVWTRGPSLGPQPCMPIVKSEESAFFLSAEVRNALGVRIGTEKIDFDRRTLRLDVGDEAFPVDTRFGTLRLDFFSNCSECLYPGVANQSWVMPVHTAEGRFSVGLNAVQRCDL